ncbi:hypothetical protein KRM28CT15_46760 [Krasilnikovia sp. M28-CT-15]
MPFWEAVFGLVRADNLDPGIDLTDPADKLPTQWFQQSGDEEPRQRWHHDLWIDPAEVQPPHRRRDRSGWPPGQRRAGPGVLGPGRPGRQQDLPMHLAEPRRR